MKRTVILMFLLALSAPCAMAGTVWSDGFSCGTPLAAPNWFGQGGTPSPTTAFVTNDPLNAGNCAMSFRGLMAGGDAYSQLLTATPGNSYVLQFDYLGLSRDGSSPGGYIGISDGFPNGHEWLAGAPPGCCGISTILINDHTWHHYSIAFDPFAPGVPCCGYNGLGQFHVMLEDYVGNNSLPPDTYFDNLEVDTVSNTPEPASMALLATGLTALLTRKRIPR